MSGTEELGRGGRLRGGAAGELVAAAYAAESAHGPRLARGLSLADLAHAVALVEGGDLAGDDAKALLRGLLELHEIPGDEFPWDPALGDSFNAREAELERRVGRSAAGWLSAGRPRREAFRVGVRLVARTGARELHDALVGQAAALARHARATRADLATDYTYLQPAQPTTVGHLLLAYAYPALRDGERMRASYAGLGASVAGAGGSAGSRWALDRARLAELLGCDGLVEHAKDAAWQADVYLELLAALAIAATHQSQLGQDFEIYASQEFGLVELDDAHSRASALMPQKKNPYALAAIRTQAGQAAGDLTGALVALHTGSAGTDHFHLLNGAVPRALDEAVAVARLTASVFDGIELRTERFAQVARESFVTAADVADVLASRRCSRLPHRAQDRGPRRPRSRRGGGAPVGLARRPGSPRQRRPRSARRSSWTRRRCGTRSTRQRALPPASSPARPPRPRWTRCSRRPRRRARRARALEQRSARAGGRHRGGAPRPRPRARLGLPSRTRAHHDSGRRTPSTTARTAFVTEPRPLAREIVAAVARDHCAGRREPARRARAAAPARAAPARL